MDQDKVVHQGLQGRDLVVHVHGHLLKNHLHIQEIVIAQINHLKSLLKEQVILNPVQDKYI